MSEHLKDYLYEEKYHPSKLDEVILPNRIRSMLKGIIESGNIPDFFSLVLLELERQHVLKSSVKRLELTIMSLKEVSTMELTLSEGHCLNLHNHLQVMGNIQ